MGLGICRNIPKTFDTLAHPRLQPSGTERQICPAKLHFFVDFRALCIGAINTTNTSNFSTRIEMYGMWKDDNRR